MPPPRRRPRGRGRGPDPVSVRRSRAVGRLPALRGRHVAGQLGRRLVQDGHRLQPPGGGGDDRRHRLRAGRRDPPGGARSPAGPLPGHAADPAAGPRARHRADLATSPTPSPPTASCAVSAPGSATTSGCRPSPASTAAGAARSRRPSTSRRRTASAVWPAPRSVRPTTSRSRPRTSRRTIWGREFEMLRDPKTGEAVITKEQAEHFAERSGVPMTYFETSDRSKRRSWRRPSRSCRW